MFFIVAGLRRWREHQWQLRATPTSADTYFQLEKASDPSSGNRLSCRLHETIFHIITMPDNYTGGIFLFGECCRIKHLSTQTYLASKTLLKNHTTIVLNGSIDENGFDVFRMLPYDEKYLSKVHYYRVI